MKIDIPVLKQKTGQGCFIACCSMIRKYFDKKFKYDMDKELEIFVEALKSNREFCEPYVINKLLEKLAEIEIITESFYVRYLLNKSKRKFGANFQVKYKIVGVNDFESALKENKILITLVDLWDITMYTHFPHFVILNGFDSHDFYMIDPWMGEQIKIPKDRFMNFVKNIKSGLGMSPMIYMIKKR